MPIMTIRRSIAVVATVSAASIAVVAPSAFAASHAAAAKTEYFQFAGASTHEEVIAHGVFTGGGTDDASHDNYDVMHLGGGTLRITHPDKDSKYKQHLDKKTCYYTATVTGPYTLGHGTGAYKKATGHGTYKGGFSAVLKRTKSGACDMNSEPTVEVTTINASGPASL
jgi:hypothetical protein